MYMYIVCMNYMYDLKPITLYVGLQLYESYQRQAKKQGRKAAELIRNAMQEYADDHFKTKNSLSALSFARTVTLKKGASDFLGDDSWKEESISGRISL